MAVVVVRSSLCIGATRSDVAGSVVTHMKACERTYRRWNSGVVFKRCEHPCSLGGLRVADRTARNDILLIVL